IAYGELVSVSLEFSSRWCSFYYVQVFFLPFFLCVISTGCGYTRHFAIVSSHSMVYSLFCTSFSLLKIFFFSSNRNTSVDLQRTFFSIS
ncbi:unnamed protein product, partial [Musa textilis]